MIGLLGAHRTGKTSLARAYAEKHGIEFIETSVSAIFRELGHDPADSFDFKTRLSIQEVILDRLDAVYGAVSPTVQAITDRTPIDMLAYTMAEAVGGTVRKREQERFEAYVQRCFEVTNKRFSTLLLVQPGIPLVKARGKAVLNQAYIEHLNSLMLGLSCDVRCSVPHFYIRRAMTEMADRITAVENAVGRSFMAVRQEATAYREAGGLLQ